LIFGIATRLSSSRIDEKEKGKRERKGKGEGRGPGPLYHTPRNHHRRFGQRKREGGRNTFYFRLCFLSVRSFAVPLERGGKRGGRGEKRET